MAGSDVREEKEAFTRRGAERSLAIAELLSRLCRSLQNAGHAEELRPAQWDALRFFAAPTSDERTATAFARYQGIQRASANETVRVLERKGLVSRAENRHNARKQDVVLTARGEQTLARDPLRGLACSISELAEEEIERLADALSVLYRMLIVRSPGHELVEDTE